MTQGRRQRRNSSRDLVGRLATQSGIRTTAPMWPRPFFTPGEWAVYTALWSYPNDAVFPSHQDLADRAWVQWVTAKDSVAKMDQLGLLEREGTTREDGSDSTNTYYLVEVPTAAHLKQLETLKAERAAEQEDKRRKRKASKRRYVNPQVNEVSASAEEGCSTGSTPVHATGGAPQRAPLYTRQGVLHREHPRGCSTESTPGCSTESTLESLGVPVGSSLDLSATPSMPEEKKDRILLEIENQEDETADSVKKPRVLPTLTAEEQALADECVALGDATWTPLDVRKVIGSGRIRELAARNPELVRRAFLIGARYRRRGEPNLPIRMWYLDGCPHWRTAEQQIAAELAAQTRPDPGPVVLSEPQVRLVPAPSAGQESQDDVGERYANAEEARAAAAAKIAAAAAKRAAAAAARPRRSPEQAPAELGRAAGDPLVPDSPREARRAHSIA